MAVAGGMVACNDTCAQRRRWRLWQCSLTAAARMRAPKHSKQAMAGGGGNYERVQRMAPLGVWQELPSRRPRPRPPPAPCLGPCLGVRGDFPSPDSSPNCHFGLSAAPTGVGRGAGGVGGWGSLDLRGGSSVGTHCRGAGQRCAALIGGDALTGGPLRWRRAQHLTGVKCARAAGPHPRHSP